MIKEVVETNDKQRFPLSENGEMIKANQGDSVSIELEVPPATPPKYCFTERRRSLWIRYKKRD